MKTYSIGRDQNCDIIISDTTDVISRRHALLNVTSSGKMTIIDQSSNGTYVNGIRISQNVPVPITRKDTISLAHVVNLDWNQVPKENKWIFYMVAPVAILLILAGIVWGINSFKENGSVDKEMIPTEAAPVDSAEIKRTEMERRDSVEKAALRDSIRMLERQKARQDAIKAAESKEKEKVKEQDSKKETDKEDDKASKQNKKKTIG